MTFFFTRTNHLIEWNNEKILIIQTIERPVIDISPTAPEPKPFYIGIKMESYEHDSWLHLQQCELIGEDGGFREIIVKDGCSTDGFLYQLQGSQNSHLLK